MGRNLVTSKIQESMGVSYEEAEDLKTSGDQNGNLPEEIIGIINSCLDSFISEVKPILDFYYTSSEDKSIKQCYVMGGTSLLSGLVDALASKLKIEVSYFDPFERILIKEAEFDGKMRSVVSSVGSVALGLAMRSLRND